MHRSDVHHQDPLNGAIRNAALRHLPTRPPDKHRGQEHSSHLTTDRHLPAAQDAAQQLPSEQKGIPRVQHQQAEADPLAQSSNCPLNHAHERLGADENV